jgi:MoaA/NifB/PqqE/SkfB family radical SAM enzyme
MKYDFEDENSSYFPPMIVVVINNTCNFQCTHCYYRKYMAYPDYHTKYLTLNLFDKIVSETCAFPHASIRLIGWGEPLLHPKIKQIVEHAKQIAPANLLTLITNGYFLMPNLSKHLIESGIDLIEVSLDAASSEAFQKRRMSKDLRAYTTIVHHIHETINIRDQKGSSTRIVVSFIVYPTQESEEEFAAFEEYWSKVADEVVKRPVHSFKGILGNIRQLPMQRIPCRCLWSRCTINPFGEISVCYNDWERTAILGNLNDVETTIAKIWRDETLRKYRNEQCKGKFRGICANCQDYNPNAWNNPYDLIIKRCRNKKEAH